MNRVCSRSAAFRNVRTQQAQDQTRRRSANPLPPPHSLNGTLPAGAWIGPAAPARIRVARDYRALDGPSSRHHRSHRQSRPTSVLTIAPRIRPGVARHATGRVSGLRATLMSTRFTASIICLNAVTESTGHGAAVLIRAQARPGLSPAEHPAPGLLCRALDIDRAWDGTDLLGDELFVVLPRQRRLHSRASSADRRGLRRHLGATVLRFYIRGNPWVSRR